MKGKNFLSAVSLFMICTLAAKAQFMRLERYPVIPPDYNGVFFDHVSEYVSGVVKSVYGQYFGQITREGDIYGYGTFYTDQDGEIVGQYRRGNLIFGIKMGTQTVKVGTENHYIVYDLRTGDPLYIIKDEQKYLLPADYKDTYRFESLTYKNGDKYVGETVGGKREGYGIYYYVNGNYYYGSYKNNDRVGYGALFKTDNNITLQYWEEKTE